MTDRADIAAAFHAQMCVDPAFGYSQGDNRWGDSSNVVTWDYGGVSGVFWVGDRDCSSSVIDCWQEALRGSAYEGALAGATWTGNMRSIFVNSGLFEWHPMGDGYIAQRGDVYLNEQAHTAMCQSAVPDELSEFVINEFGGITGGAVGDQTGWESRIVPYYDFPWDGILAYNGAADTEEEPDDGKRGVHTHTPNQTDAQKWTFEPTDTADSYVLRNVACGKYLMLNRDIPRGDGYAVCVGYEPDVWTITQLRATPPLDKPVYLTCNGLYLDVVDGRTASGAGIQARSKSASRHGQKWALVWAGAESTYFLHNLKSDMCLDVDNAGRL